MPQITGPLQPEGAILDALVGLDRTEIQKLRRTLQPVPQAKQIRALIDSGAETTCLDLSIIKALALPWSGPVLANVPAVGGLTLTSLYRAGVTLLHSSNKPRLNYVIADLAVCELSLGLLGYDAVIGRDILDRLRFTYDGPGRTFTLDWN